MNSPSKHRYLPAFQKSLNAVLKIDPSLKPIVDSHVFHAFLDPVAESRSSFEYLVRNVISQQVSGAAGNAILKRFVQLCSAEEKFPTPDVLLKFNVEELRGAGLSVRKAEYVRGLAESYIAGDLSDSLLQSLDDDEVVDKIVSIRGLGQWTAQMFLIFYLHRLDTFSVGDVGVQRGVRKYIKERPHILKELASSEAIPVPASPGKSKKARAKVPLPKDMPYMEQVAARFAPHRTAFQMIMWKLSDIEMKTVEAREAVANEERSPKRRKTAAQAKSLAASKAKPISGSEPEHESMIPSLEEKLNVVS